MLRTQPECAGRDQAGAGGGAGPEGKESRAVGVGGVWRGCLSGGEAGIAGEGRSDAEDKGLGAGYGADNGFSKGVG